MNEFFFAALSFGLAAGLKPEPLGIIVIQQTLSKGLPAGVRASLAPLITDGPIIIAALWLLTQFKSIDLFAAALGLLGGLYIGLACRKDSAVKANFTGRETRNPSFSPYRRKSEPTQSKPIPLLVYGRWELHR
jgi:threonine/homoserine/homoserine lactone efflux protein